MHTILLSVNEAALLFGISDKTIRRAVAQNEIRHTVELGRYKINFESLLRWTQRRPRTRTAFRKKGLGQFLKVRRM